MNSLLPVFSIENLEALLSPKRKKYYYGIFQNSELTPVIQASIPKKHTIPLSVSKQLPFYLNDLELVAHSNLLKVPLPQGHFFIGIQPEAKLTKKLQARGLSCIGNTIKTQEKYEHKIFFHKFAVQHALPVPRGWIIKDKKALKTLHTFPCVIQEPESYGSFGTFILKDASQLRALLEERTFTFPLLAREYVSGLPCGITILIDKKHYCISAVRLQASLLEKQSVAFHGVQWIPYTVFSKTQRAAIEKMASKTAQKLKQEKFVGLVNIDFMLTETAALLIECNPRISGSTWQLSQHPSLFHGNELIERWGGLTKGRGLVKTYDALPKTSFTGATLDLDIYQPYVIPGKPRTSNIPSGVYIIKNGVISFLSYDIDDFKGLQTFFALSGTARGACVNSQQGLGVIISNNCFYDWDSSAFTGNSITLNKVGNQVKKFAKKVAL